MHLITPLPTALQAAHAAREHEAATVGQHARDQRAALSAALEIWRRDYDEIFRAQPPGHRYHKGQPLANIGALTLYGGDPRSGTEAMMLAFMEDALSRAEESPGHYDELYRTAAFNLVFPLGLPGRNLMGLCDWARVEVRAGRYYPDPTMLLGQGPVRDALNLAEPYVGKRIPGQFGSDFERRVFVGGAYKDGRLDSVVRPLRDTINQFGFDGVVPADFIELQLRTDEHALMLQANCSRAVFEGSVAGGWEVEVRAATDSMRRRMIVVFDRGLVDRAQLSWGMVGEALRDWGVAERGYASEHELRAIVETFLGV